MATAHHQVLINVTFTTSGQGVVVQINQITGAASQANTSVLTLNNALRFAGFAGAIGFVHSALHALTGFIGDSVEEAKKLQAALTGLSSTAAFKGISPGQATDAVKNLFAVKAGLISIGEASTAAKNLLQANFNLTQTIDIINRMSDSASFARQGSLSFGRAVVGATEGIRNQNSILSDNAGLTKNLSLILKERKFTLSDLSDAVKGVAAREALYQGILVETADVQGNAAKYSQLYAGQVSKLDAAYGRLQATLGTFVTDSKGVADTIGVTADAINDLTIALGATPQESPIFTFLDRQIQKTTAGALALKILLLQNAPGEDYEGRQRDALTLERMLDDIGPGKTLKYNVDIQLVPRILATQIDPAAVIKGYDDFEKELKKTFKETQDSKKRFDTVTAQESKKARGAYLQALYKDDPLALIQERSLQEQRDLHDKFTPEHGGFQATPEYKQAQSDIINRNSIESAREITKTADAAYSALDALRSTYATQTGNPFVAIALAGETAVSKLREEMTKLPDDMKAVAAQSIATQQSLTGLSYATAAGGVARSISDTGAELRALTEPTFNLQIVPSANGGIAAVSSGMSYARETEQQKLARLFNDAPAAEAIYRAAFEKSGLSAGVAATEARKMANQGFIGEARGFDLNTFDPGQRAQYAQQLEEYREDQGRMLKQALDSDARQQKIEEAVVGLRDYLFKNKDPIENAIKAAGKGTTIRLEDKSSAIANLTRPLLEAIGAAFDGESEPD